MSDVENWNRLDEILYRADDGLTVYVYRVDKRGRESICYVRIRTQGCWTHYAINTEVEISAS